MGILDQINNLLSNPAQWLLQSGLTAIFGNGGSLGKLGDAFAATLQASGLDLPTGCGSKTGGDCVYYAIWIHLVVLAHILIGSAVLVRVLTVLAAGKRSGGSISSHLLVDVFIRMAAASMFVQISYGLISWASGLSFSLGEGLLSDIVRIGVKPDFSMDGLSALTVSTFMGTGSAVQLVTAALVIYLSLMLFAARVCLLFATVTAPLVVPLWAYGEHSSLLRWWAQVLGGALLVPIVAGAALGVSLVFTSHVSSAPAAGPLFGAAAAVGSLWMTAKLLRACTSVLFQHHGVLHAAEIGIGAVALLPRVTSLARQVGAAGGSGGRILTAAADVPWAPGGPSGPSGSAAGGNGLVPSPGQNRAFDEFVASEAGRTAAQPAALGVSTSSIATQAGRSGAWARFLAARPLGQDQVGDRDPAYPPAAHCLAHGEA